MYLKGKATKRIKTYTVSITSGTMQNNWLYFNELFMRNAQLRKLKAILLKTISDKDIKNDVTPQRGFASVCLQ